jgi:hypothetical protein
MPSTLPHDIVHLIVQDIRGDARALKQCARVNRSWLHEAQPLLFSTNAVCIDFFDEPQSPEPDRWVDRRGPREFMQLLSESPHLRSLICIVKLCPGRTVEGLDAQRQSMTTLLSPLHEAGLRTIKTLVLHDKNPVYYEKIILDLPPSDVDPGWQRSLSSVTCLDIGAWINTPSVRLLQHFLCSSFPQLRHLVIRRWPLIQEPSLRFTPPPDNLSLHRLDIARDISERKNGAIFMAWLSQTRMMDTLEHLTSLNGRDVPILTQFTEAIKKPWSLQIPSSWCESSISLTLIHFLTNTYRHMEP